MAGKSSKSKAGTKGKATDRQARQMRWAQVAFSIIALIMVLSMVLALIGTSTK